MSRDIKIEITEQPKQRGMRFRYECEGRSAGSIPGENTTNDKKTWPACQIINYQGVAVIRVSLVSKDDPPRPHPHSLVGRDCNNGICQVTVDSQSQMQGLFPNLGIQCVRRKEVSTAIRDRLQLGVNPFNATANGDERTAIDVDLNIVRLCFEAFLPDRHGSFNQKLKPVVSNPIYDKKAPSSSLLKICRVDKTAGSVLGKEEVFLLCDKVQKEDIQVVFSHKGWEALGDFSAPDVHRQVAIVFKTPPYHDEHIQHSVEVEVRLRRPSDMETSAPLIFTYTPVQQELPYKVFPHPMFPSRNNQLNSNIRQAIVNRTVHKRYIQPPPGGDRTGIPLKRPYPMPQPMNPAFGGPMSMPRQTFNRQPYQSPSMWRPRSSTLPPPHPSSTHPPHQPASTIPQPHPTSVKSEATISIDYRNSPFPQQVPQGVPLGASNMSDFPSLFECSTVSSQQNQFNDVTLDSLPSLGPEGTSQVLSESTLPATSAASNIPKLEEPLIHGSDISTIDFLFQQHCSIENSDVDKSLLSLLQDNPAPTDSMFPTTNAQPPPHSIMQKQVDSQLPSNHQVMSPQQLPPQVSSVPPHTMMSPHPMSPPQAANAMLPNSLSPHPNIMSPGPGVMSPQAVPNSAASTGFSAGGQPLATHQTNFYSIAQGDHVEFGFSPQGMNQVRNNTNNNNNFGDGREDSLDMFLKKFSN